MAKIDIDPLKAIYNRDIAVDERHALLDCAAIQDTIIYMVYTGKLNIGRIKNIMGAEFVVSKINGLL